DNFSATSRQIHHQTARDFFLNIYKKGHLKKKTINQLFCPNDNKFLPDRYVEGICPKCNAAEARGDQCESCGSQLDPVELLDPRCKICNAVPVLKETFHWFLKLGEFQQRLIDWHAKNTGWKENVINYCKGWFNEGLTDRAITRDMDWGIAVPLEEAKNKVLYVWFDAPIGYISSTIEWAQNQGKPDLWKNYWQNPECTLIHFIGKDNIVFHAIVWPAVLMAQGGYILPRHIPANEFLNIEGSKASTSRNRAIWVHEYLENFPSDSLRYYIASIAPETKDSDFNWKEFAQKHNSELADIYGNFINRTFLFIKKYFNGTVPDLKEPSDADLNIFQFLISSVNKIGEYLDGFHLRSAVKNLMDIAREGNKYFNDKSPWKTRKSDIRDCSNSLHVSLQIIKCLAIVSLPFIPKTAKKIWYALNQENEISTQDWRLSPVPNLQPGHPLREIDILFKKIEEIEINRELTKLGR
ncbi:MAG: methionine--tRNA ligase, partial [bacterium]